MGSKKVYERVFSGGRFLDTDSVGSSVRWKVDAAVSRVEPKDESPYTRPDIDSEIALSDCSRIITWSDYSDDQESQLLKVRGAIEELQACERALVKAIKEVGKRNVLPKDGDDD